MNQRPLVEALFEAAGIPAPAADVQVEALDDGGMGSLAFAPTGRTFGANVAECEFTDRDGVLVSVALYVDADGEPLELDVWKVNFAPTRQWPQRGELSNMTVNADALRHPAAARPPGARRRSPSRYA
jgi:hypothetical protein